MRRIKLTQGKFTLVSDIDYAYLNQWKWFYSQGYVGRNVYFPKHTSVWMHRVILERMGFKNFKRTDHKDGKTLNNCRINLRPATYTENARNQRKRINNTSGYKGVSWHRHNKKWVVQIMWGGKRKCLGYFNTKICAAKEYNRAVKQHYGKFAKVNIL